MRMAASNVTAGCRLNSRPASTTFVPCGMAFGHVVFGFRLVQPVVDLVPVISWVDADDFRRVGAHIHCTLGPMSRYGISPRNEGSVIAAKST